MRLHLGSLADEQVLFFAAGNQPTQVAYALTSEDITDAFIVSVLRSERVLLAASFFFESAATRALVQQFPKLWTSDRARSLFFINASYPSFLDHGLGKVEKSPPSFDPYAKVELVRQQAGTLDRLGIVGLRDDIDISAALAGAWIRSCTSTESGSIGSILWQKVDPRVVEDAVAVCARVAERRQYDFIWPAIEFEIRTDDRLRLAYADLRRALADLYAQIMSIALGAIETTPTLALIKSPLTERAIGQLGRFSTLLRRVGIEPRAIREESKLLQLLALDQLLLLREVDNAVLGAAIEMQATADDLWRAIALSEERPGVRPQLTDIDVRSAFIEACEVVGISPTDSLLQRVSAIERFYKGGFLRHFRSRVEEILVGRLHRPAAVGRLPVADFSLQDVLLFVSADPNTGGPAMRLEVDRERKAISAALNSLGPTCGLRIEAISAVEIDEIHPSIIRYRPRFFHFSGHGDVDGNIFIQGHEGRVTTSIHSIVEALSLSVPQVECAVFHSCYSLTALDRIGARGVRYLVLARSRVGDAEARAFSASFYLAVAAGLEVPQAFALGCNRLTLEHGDWDTLRLFERVGQTGATETEANAGPWMKDVTPVG